jgi:hypothetical protein
MSTPARCLHALTLAAVVPALLLPLALAGALGFDPATLRGLTTSLQDAQRRRRDLEESRRAFQAQHEAKRRVGRALASGEITLDEAAARLSDIHHADPGFCWYGFGAAYPDMTDDERHRRHAADIAVLVAREEWGEAAAARQAARLEGELRGLAACGDVSWKR